MGTFGNATVLEPFSIRGFRIECEPSARGRRMAIRQRTWKTATGVEKEAWVVDYVDQAGKRRLKSFERKRSADSFNTTAKNEVRAGTHTADSSSITVGQVGD